ncbi:MAG: hypothetical protein ABF750_08110 [Oenococcus oeni]
MIDYKTIESKDKQFFGKYSLKGLKILAETYQHALAELNNQVAGYLNIPNQDPDLTKLLASFYELTQKADTR